MPRSCSDFCSILPATSSSWRSISHSLACTTATSHAALHQAVGGLQAQQAAANDHGVFVGARCVDHGLRVRNVAVGQHAPVLPGMGSMKGWSPWP